LGNAKACNVIGEIYLEGLVIQQDIAEACQWFRRGADRKFPRALENLGVIYLGGRGMAPRLNEALRLFEKAKMLGGIDSLISTFGEMFLRGRGNCPRDLAAARMFLQKGAELGDTKAADLLKEL
jgi:TPR repeat protein